MQFLLFCLIVLCVRCPCHASVSELYSTPLSAQVDEPGLSGNLERSNHTSGSDRSRFVLTARLKALLKTPHLVDHVLQELDRRQAIPGDPYGLKKELKLRGLPAFNEAPWLSNVTDAQLKSMAPSWHGHFVLKIAPGCSGCKMALAAVEHASHIAYRDHELRMCAAFSVVDSRQTDQVSAENLLAGARRPVLYWIPPLHEQHAEHEKPMAFHGPWSVQKLLHFVNNKCSRASRIGRVYVADLLASQFSSAADSNAQRQVYESFKLLLWVHTEGRMNVATQQYMRYYAEIMENALERGYADHSYFQREAAKLWTKLQVEVHRDALSEVTSIRHNVLQAFLESATHPMDTHPVST